jgi:lysyl endopeptidase
MNRREWIHLVLGLGVVMLTVGISFAAGNGNTLVPQVDLYLDQHHTPGDCEGGQERIVLYQSSFESGDGYDRGWQVTGLEPTWVLVDYSYRGKGWRAHGRWVSDQHLISPPIDLPANASRLRLRFYHKTWIEPSKVNCYDGGVLETSSDGGATWSQVTPDKLVNDWYDGTILPYTGNPLAGRVAWCTKRSYWLDAVVDLDEYAGETILFRFRLGTDSSVTSIWDIDEVRVYACRNSDAPSLYLPILFR